MVTEQPAHHTNDAVYLTIELRPGDGAISGRLRHEGTARVIPFSGWTGLIAGIQQIWRQAVTETSQQIPGLKCAVGAY
jgi:hypothetical protein